MNNAEKSVISERKKAQELARSIRKAKLGSLKENMLEAACIELVELALREEFGCYLKYGIEHPHRIEGMEGGDEEVAFIKDQLTSIKDPVNQRLHRFSESRPERTRFHFDNFYQEEFRKYEVTTTPVNSGVKAALLKAHYVALLDFNVKQGFLNIEKAIFSAHHKRNFFHSVYGQHINTSLWKKNNKRDTNLSGDSEKAEALAKGIAAISILNTFMVAPYHNSYKRYDRSKSSFFSDYIPQKIQVLYNSKSRNSINIRHKANEGEQKIEPENKRIEDRHAGGDANPFRAVLKTAIGNYLGVRSIKGKNWVFNKKNYDTEPYNAIGSFIPTNIHDAICEFKQDTLLPDVLNSLWEEHQDKLKPEYQKTIKSATKKRSLGDVLKDKLLTEARIAKNDENIGREFIVAR